MAPPEVLSPTFPISLHTSTIKSRRLSLRQVCDANPTHFAKSASNRPGHPH
jgi:hypothetical protein